MIPCKFVHNMLDKVVDIMAIWKDDIVNKTNIEESKHVLYSATKSEEYVNTLKNYQFKQPKQVRTAHLDNLSKEDSVSINDNKSVTKRNNECLNSFADVKNVTCIVLKKK